MAINATFSVYKDPDNIGVGKMRRIRHSLTQKIGSMGKGEAALEAVDKAALAAGVVSAGSAVAVGLGSTAAFAAAISGPQAAVTLTVIGAVMAAKGTYSNRDSAHKQLSPYVWSFIDDMAPREWGHAEKINVAGAAVALISDGQAQVKAIDSKLKQVEKVFNDWWNEYRKVSKYHYAYAGSNEFLGGRGGALGTLVLQNEAARFALLEKAYAKDGAVREYMRRLSHMANYLQAGAVFSRVLQTENGIPSPPLGDFGSTNQLVKDTRVNLAKISERIVDDQKAAEIAEKIN